MPVEDLSHNLIATARDLASGAVELAVHAGAMHDHPERVTRRQLDAAADRLDRNVAILRAIGVVLEADS